MSKAFSSAAYDILRIFWYYTVPHKCSCCVNRDFSSILVVKWCHREACVGQAGLLSDSGIILHPCIHAPDMMFSGQTGPFLSVLGTCLSTASPFFAFDTSYGLCMYYPGLMETGACSQVCKAFNQVSPPLGMSSVHSDPAPAAEVSSRTGCPPWGPYPVETLLFKLTFCINNYWTGNKSMYCRLQCLHDSFPQSFIFLGHMSEFKKTRCCVNGLNETSL